MLQKWWHKFPALHSHDFRLLWIGQLVSTLGSQMQMVALNWHIYELTHSPVALGMIGLFRVIPIIIFSLIAGTFADAHNRKKVLFITQISMTVLSLLLTALTFSHLVNAPYIFLITILSAVAMSFDMPARQAFVPSLVKNEHLTNAMSLNSMVWEISLIGGSSLAGLVIASFNVGSVYLFNSLSFIAVLYALWKMNATGEVTGPKTPIGISSIIEGLRFVKSKTIVWSTMLLDFFSTFFASATALLPIFAKDILHVGPQGLGFLYAAPGIGAVLTSLIISHIGELRNQGKILLSGIVVYAIGTILFGFSKLFPLSFFGLFLIGAGDSLSTIIRNTVRQLVTPDSIRGRMTSINMIFFMGGPQLGEFEAGILASVLGGPVSVIIGGVATLCIVGAATIGIPSLRNFDRHEKE
jgi:MFS family permease